MTTLLLLLPLLLGTKIISDAMTSYSGLPEAGYPLGVVVHKREFVSSEDTSVHTQNTEVRHSWLKTAIKSFKRNRPLQSYIAQYT